MANENYIVINGSKYILVKANDGARSCFECDLQIYCSHIDGCPCKAFPDYNNKKMERIGRV